MYSSNSIKDIQCKILRGETIDWSEKTDHTWIHRFLASSEYHGIQPLLYHQLQSALSWDSCPDTIKNTLLQAVRQQTVLEMMREPLLITLIDTLTKNHIFPILMKGSALSYTHYPSSNLRPRCDTDLFIQKRDLGKLTDLLQTLGYTTYPTRGELSSYQALFIKQTFAGIQNHLDIHWCINNRQFFAATLDYASAYDVSVSIPQLHPQARCLAPSHALLLACLHRAANLLHNKRDESDASRDRLIWLYDIHLLINAMTARELDLFIQLCQRFQVKTVCLDALRSTQKSLHTALPQSVLDALTDTKKTELSAGYLTSSRLKVLYIDLISLPRWRDRIKLLKEYCLPDKKYLLNDPASDKDRWLPLAYIRYWLQIAKKTIRDFWVIKNTH